MMEDYVANREGRLVMEDRAWRQLFGRVVEQTERTIISLVPIVRQCDGGANKTNMIAAIMLDQGCSEPTARKMLDRCVDRGLIICATDKGNATRLLYNVHEGVQPKLVQIDAVLWLIEAVLLAQKKEPTNFVAGRSLLPEHFAEIYFNARDPKTTAVMKQKIATKARQIKESKKMLHSRLEKTTTLLALALGLIIVTTSASLADRAALYDSPDGGGTTIIQK